MPPGKYASPVKRVMTSAAARLNVLCPDVNPGKAGVTNVRTVMGEPNDPKLPEPVDVALLHDVLHHIENPAVYIKSLAKYLKPGARIVIDDYVVKQGPHRDDPSLQVGKDEAAKLLAAIGFKPAEDVALFPDKYFVIYGR